MRVEAVGVVIVAVVVVGVFLVEFAQGEIGNRHQFAGPGIVVQQAVKEALKVGAYPVNTLRLGKGAAIGRSECEGVW